MSVEMTTCGWCLQEAVVQIIEERLWDFWKIISAEDPVVASPKKICRKCRLRYEQFSKYMEKCKSHASIVDEILVSGQVEEKPSIDVEYHPVIKKELLQEEESHSSYPTISGGTICENRQLPGCSNLPDPLLLRKIKEESPLEIEDHLIIEEDAVEGEVASPDRHVAGDGKAKAGLVLRIVLKREELSGSKARIACSICDKVFKYRNSMKRHLSVHASDNPFKCSYCDKTFAHSSTLNPHLRHHRGDKPFICSYCNKAFNYSGWLKVHLRIHTGDKPYKCSYCIKAFANSTTLRNHLCLHTGDRPFKCSHCNRSFTQSSNLKHHLLRHTGEKPFKCLHCNKTFARRFSLNSHLHLHSAVKPFQCSHCNKTYTQSSSLRLHLRIHTGEKPFKCSHCNESFHCRSNLNRHHRSIHAH